MSSLIFRNRRNPAEYGVLNFMAGTNGFTMMDMFPTTRSTTKPTGKTTGTEVITTIPGTAAWKDLYVRKRFRSCGRDSCAMPC